MHRLVECVDSFHLMNHQSARRRKVPHHGTSGPVNEAFKRAGKLFKDFRVRVRAISAVFSVVHSAILNVLLPWITQLRPILFINRLTRGLNYGYDLQYLRFWNDVPVVVDVAESEIEILV